MSHNRRYERSEVEAAMKKMPTFSHDHIDLVDMDAFVQEIGYSYTTEQRDAYITFFRDSHDSKILVEVLVAALGAIDDSKELMRIHVTALDKDKDGFIDESEFKSIIPFLLSHDPSFPKVKFDKFVEEADTNKDGKVSIGEAVEWFSKNAKK
ncbi:probable calcium-binding protein CML13 [Folsomia candida]|uniref:Putative calcium-binding protein CML47 n=1 Tax=Folsomia candida TaxID=158441 RepID=A0A226D0Y8_FOLCA|nr:probable calcium-binding protein CML13 [Folsomia candida]OXA38843.1 putative calcium-binding protein CML47 [Folsomia candida]